MHDIIEQMLAKYTCKTSDDYRNALKEIIQEIALLGLSRSNFFDKAAFYGGTALRIFYKMDRFSEDLDFSLLKKNDQFSISKYLKAIENELGSFGFETKVLKKNKTQKSNIASAFIKGNTYIHLLKINATPPMVAQIHKDEVLKIKFELDTMPPSGAEYEVKYNLNPVPHSVKLFSPSSLFAGKLHALLCRNWGTNRTKGRDLYDFIWFINNSIFVNLYHLEQRMRQTRHFRGESSLTNKILLSLLMDKFASIDYIQAKNDVIPFIKDPFAVEIWSEDFFCNIINKIQFS